MSLLIKALDKAEKAQTEKAQESKLQVDKTNAQSELNTKPKAQNAKSKSPETALLQNELMGDAGLDFDLVPLSMRGSAATNTAMNVSAAESSQSASQKSVSATPTQAANVFASKRVEATNQNAKLALIVGAGLVTLLAMGAYFYRYVDAEPKVAMLPSRPPVQVTAPNSVTQEQQVAARQTVEPPLTQPDTSANETPVIDASHEVNNNLKAQAEPQSTQLFEAKSDKSAKKVKEKSPKDTEASNNDVESSLTASEQVVTKPIKLLKAKQLKTERLIASDSVSIEVTQKSHEPSVNPTLMRAYDTYVAGNLSEAQKLYKQVLQGDSNNIDAMLGLGAIANKQGRNADANGWHRKVLELDPKNSVAQAALLEPQQTEGGSESRLKNMLAKSPNDANLHAALGNYYAEQNQWVAAQQAYFDAFRFNANADNALNLAVSLDQMGKPKLALPYYQQALQLAQQSGNSNLDRAAIEARIAALK